MREAKKDNQPETMGNDSTSSDGLASVMETCLSGRQSSSTGKRQDSFCTPAALWLWGLPIGCAHQTQTALSCTAT